MVTVNIILNIDRFLPLASSATVADSKHVALACLILGMVLGVALGLRAGVWYTLRKIGKHEFRNRRNNINNTSWFGGG
jgi:hypothetical protein